MTPRLQDERDEPRIAKNKAGAGGKLAAPSSKEALPEGTLLCLRQNLTVSILLLGVKHPGFDPAHELEHLGDFAHTGPAIGSPPSA